MNENIVMTAGQYDRIDGRDAYGSNIKRLTLGAPSQAVNKKTPIAAQIWEQTADGDLEICAELSIHQVLDLMIFLGRTMLHFREAYRLPLLYDPEKPTVERVGIQGGVMPVSICTENPNINEDIKKFSQSLSDLGELTGERLRVLARILEEMEYY